MRKLLIRSSLILLGAVAATLAAEAAVRLRPAFAMQKAARELWWIREGQSTQSVLTTDPELGFRPILGNELYDENGTLKNQSHAAHLASSERLLFLGDSVTARGKLVEALRLTMEGKGQDYAYFNAGVESYNTVQEAGFYTRYNRHVEPDHVILTFHYNDFETTPIVFRDAEGRLTAHAPDRPLAEMSPWLFEHSHLYRVWLAKTGGSQAPEQRARIEHETAASLEHLRDAVRADGAQLSLLVYPPACPESQWTDAQKMAHRKALELAAELGIRSFDLAKPLASALEQGIETCETPSDVAHPSAPFAEHCAQWLVANGLFAGK